MEDNFKRAVTGAAVGAGLALAGVPAGIGALGFTATGITPGSVAAKMMLAAATDNSGGVAAGSTVAMLQSIDESCRFLPGTKIGLTSMLGLLGAAAGVKLFKGKTTPHDEPN